MTRSLADETLSKELDAHQSATQLGGCAYGGKFRLKLRDWLELPTISSFDMRKEHHMKQQCNISYVYGSWLILICGLMFHLFRGNYLQAGLWVFFIALCLWLYVRYFPSISRYLGYGSVEDLQPKNIQRVKTDVTLYTGLGCPFCPLVKNRLKELQPKMGFDLKEIDVTLRPELLIKKGIRSLPVVEVGKAHWVGNATSEQLATFITQNIFST